MPMFLSRRRSIAAAVLAFAVFGLTSCLAASSRWTDSYFQYRLPLVVDAADAGWQIIDVSEADIVNAINELEELKYHPGWFAYNYVTLVETDAVTGNPLNTDLSSAFYMVPVAGEEAIKPARQGDSISLEVSPGAIYLLRYTKANGGQSPLIKYEPIHDRSLRDQGFDVSYAPPLLPLAKTDQEQLFVPDVAKVELLVNNGWTDQEIASISAQRVEIKLLANLSHAGKTPMWLYYQPMGGHYLMTPEKRREQLPAATARRVSLGGAEKQLGQTRYRLQTGGNQDATIWFADSIVKLTPATPPPDCVRPRARISSARNERQSFQLVVRPHKSLALAGISASNLCSASGAVVDASNVQFERAEYVPILRTSPITTAHYTGPMADPLVPITPGALKPDDGNAIVWVTLKADRDTPAGVYAGQLRLTFTDSPAITIPIEYEVFDFALPEYSRLQVNMGGQYFVNQMDRWVDRSKPQPPGYYGLFGYHGLRTIEDLKTLADRYFTVMAENKFLPKTPALCSEIKLKWKPPQAGYGVEAPGNYFVLYDWDFSEFNATLHRYIDELKVNTFTLTHTNPIGCHRFTLLPGERLNGLENDSPHITMATQMFNRRNIFAYGRRSDEKGYQNEIIDITRDQYDHLLLDYYRKLAENLKQHGWLEEAVILIDETMDHERLLHFLKLLKSDPVASQMRIGICVQGHETMNYKIRPEDENYAFTGLLDFYIPQCDENYNRWEKYMAQDYALGDDRRKIWNYSVESSRLVIDTPGVNNRIIGLDIFNRGASGFFVWETIFWGSEYERNPNPWKDPFSVWGNGAVCYFYPPDREKGASEAPDFSVTPSERVMTFRESADDYDYAVMLQDLVASRKSAGDDASLGQCVLDDIARTFHNSAHWSQNDAWLLELRQRMAQAIVTLNRPTTAEQPAR